jgi:glycosyltransferase involved in cell wall biosynthesis
VGDLCPRKNIGTVVRVVEQLRRDAPDLRLVLAGKSSFGWAGSSDEAEVERSAAWVHRLGYVSSGELWRLYRHARALLHLAHHEGFGFPVLEALSAGTAVVASRRGGIPEAGGPAAWLVDPDDADAAVGALRTILGGGPEVVARRELGVIHARSFSWTETVRGVKVAHELAIS